MYSKIYTNKEISFFVKAYILTNPMDETTAPVLDIALPTFLEKDGSCEKH